MDENRKRRRFRFKLRTLFVIVTLFAVWLGWSFNWIRQRREFLRDGDAFRVGESVRAPALLWIFGEEGAEKIWLVARKSSASDEARRLFPEAKISDFVLIHRPGWFKP